MRPARLTTMAHLFCLLSFSSCFAVATARCEEYRIGTFSADVTVPLGHGMMGGSWLSTRIDDPLEAIGVVILGPEPAIVIVAVDWCEIRNEALDRWKEALAQAAGTIPERVLVSTIHQHDAPVADLEAERLLRSRHLTGTVCDLEFHETAVKRVAAALTRSLSETRPVSHVGTGIARVEKVASNRRYWSGGDIRFDRMSRSTNAEAIAAEEGLIDPWLRTISFWDGDQAVAALSAYSVHPMSYYGQGHVSADFPGLARRRRQIETPGTTQIYLTGCAGNIVAGKYNDGSPKARLDLADRLHQGMEEAWSHTKRTPLERIEFRAANVRFEPRSGPGFSEKELESKLAPETRPFDQCLAAMGLSWRRRLDAGYQVQIPCVDFGPALYLLLPGESYVEYQLAAEKLRPDALVLVAGYGEGGTGYIPTEKHIEENDPNLHDWWWVAPGSEDRLLEAIRQVVKSQAETSQR